MKIDKRICQAHLVASGDLESIRQTWIISRPLDPDPDMEQVLSMDVPVNEFLFLHFQLYAPIIIREIICSFRNHIVWARSSRVDDLDRWAIWDRLPLAEEIECQRLYKDMQIGITNGEHQDTFRQSLPLAYMTTINFGMSLRDLVKFIIALRLEDNRLFDDIAFALMRSFKDQGLRKVVSDAVNKMFYTTRKLFPVPDEGFPENEEPMEFGGFIMLSEKISIQLRSQLIRHRAIIFRDNIRKYFSPESLSSSMMAEVDMKLIIPKDFAESLVRKRSCWIAQTDLWEPIVRKLMRCSGVLLPCDDGKCRFLRDNELRLEGKDPSPYCPRLASLQKKDMGWNYREEALEYAAGRPEFDFWKKEIDNVQI